MTCIFSPCCRRLYPDDRRIAMEINALTRAGKMQTAKSQAALEPGAPAPDRADKAKLLALKRSRTRSVNTGMPVLCNTLTCVFEKSWQPVERSGCMP